MRTPPKILRLALVAAAVVGTLVTPAVRSAEASCGTQPFIGQVCTFAFNYCPKGFAVADGRLLSINEHQALFALLGTTFGGDGQTTFALPDLQGRTAVGSNPSFPVGATGGNASTVNLRAASSSSGVQVPASQSPFVGLTRCIALDRGNNIYPPHP